MPNGFSEPWERTDVEMNRIAVLWLALREHVPDTGNRLEDVFVGKQLVVLFTGDREGLLEETEREQRGQPFSNEQFQMMVAVASDRYLLNPDDAVCMNEGELWRLAEATYPDELGNGSIHVPRIPRDAAAEAKAMLAMTTITADATKPVADPEGRHARLCRLHRGRIDARQGRSCGGGPMNAALEAAVETHRAQLRRMLARLQASRNRGAEQARQHVVPALQAGQRLRHLSDAAGEVPELRLRLADRSLVR